MMITKGERFPPWFDSTAPILGYSQKQYTKKKGKEAMMQGFYFQLGRKEVFIETSRKRITDAFLEKVLLKLLLPVNPDTKAELRYYIIPACCEIKHCEPCADLGVESHDYYNIFGKNFSGYGSRVDDGRTIILKID